MQPILLLASLFIIILIGFFAARSGLIEANTRPIISKYIFNVAIPASALINLVGVTKDEIETIKIFILSNLTIQIVIVLALFVILQLFKKFDSKIKYQFLYSTVSGNIMYFGLPILLNLFGESYYKLGMIYAVLMITFGEVLTLMLVQYGSKQKVGIMENIKEFLKMPFVIATGVSIFLFTLDINLPNFLVTSLETLTKTITGLALFSLGLSFADNMKFDIKNVPINLISTFIKLFLIPGIVYFITYNVLHLSTELVTVSVIQASTPTAVFSIVVADIYNLDKKFASSNVLISSIMFIGSLIFWIWMLGKI